MVLKTITIQKVDRQDTEEKQNIFHVLIDSEEIVTYLTDAECKDIATLKNTLIGKLRGKLYQGQSVQLDI